MTSQPSTSFMQRHFEGYASHVASALVAAGLATHERSIEAKRGSGLVTNESYGATFWLALAQEVATRLMPVLPKARRVRPPQSRYDVLEWNGALILPVKVLDGTAQRPDSMRVRTSPLRRRLFSLNQSNEHQLSLLDALEGLDSLEDLGAPDVLESLGWATRGTPSDEAMSAAMVVVAFVCTADGGLTSVIAGVGTLDPDGTIVWTERELLPIVGQLDLATRPRLAGGSSFGEAPQPRPQLNLVANDDAQAASGEQPQDGAGDQTGDQTREQASEPRPTDSQSAPDTDTPEHD